jgi:hypothetical protein
LFNGEFVNKQARHFADRLVKEAGNDARKQVALGWRLALCRPPNKTETAQMLEFRRNEIERLLAEAASQNRPVSNAQMQQAALEQVCRVILNLNEFAYPE